MMKHGSFAVAVVQRQVVVVQAAQSQGKRDKYVSVNTYFPFGGDGLFVTSPLPSPSRIASSDVLRVISEDGESDSCSLMSDDGVDICDEGMIKLPACLLQEFASLTAKQAKKNERAWTAWVSKR